MRVIELFAGIGACSTALTRLGIEHEIVDAVENDKYAIASFNAIHGTEFEVQDILTWDKEIEADLICGGFPCQDISVAGKQAGIIKGKTRSGLMYEMMRIIDKIKPKYIVTENVKNLMSEKYMPKLQEYIKFLEKNNYEVSLGILNARDYDIPQNRERVFIVAYKKELNKLFKMPLPIRRTKSIKDILGFQEKVEEKYYYTPGKYKGNIYELLLQAMDDENTVYQWRRKYVRKNQSNLIPTLTANMGLRRA